MKNLSTALLATIVALAACSEDTSNEVGDATIEIAGTYSNPFPNEEGDDTEVITSVSWSDPYGSYEIVEFDNTENWAVTQNPSDAMFNADLYNRVVWTEPAGAVVFYCIVDFGLETVDAAKASTMTADATEPETSGCGDFAWTQLTAKP